MVAQIAIREDGGWVVQYLGNHMGQGGPMFGMGSIGSRDLKFLVKGMLKTLQKNYRKYMDMVEAIKDTSL